jgi:hypothetical protein
MIGSIKKFVSEKCKINLMSVYKSKSSKNIKKIERFAVKVAFTIVTSLHVSRQWSCLGQSIFDDDGRSALYREVTKSTFEEKR